MAPRPTEICLLVNTGAGNKHRNKSLIIVPMKTKGVNIARKLDKLGMRASDTAQIYFDEVRVPKRNRIVRKARLHLSDAAVPGRSGCGPRRPA